MESRLLKPLEENNEANLQLWWSQTERLPER